MSPDDPPPPPGRAAEKEPLTSAPPVWSYAPAPVVPPKKKHTKRNWALVVSLPVVVVFIGIATASGGSASGGGGSASDYSAATTVPAAATTTTPAATTTAPAATTTTPAAATTLDPDSAYLAHLDAINSGFTQDSASSLLGDANAVCEQLGEGYSWQSIAAAFLEVNSAEASPLSEGQVANVIGASAGYICPQYNDLVP